MGVHVRVQLLPTRSHHHVPIHLVPHAVAAVRRKTFDLRQRGEQREQEQGVSNNKEASASARVMLSRCDGGPIHTIPCGLVNDATYRYATLKVKSSQGKNYSLFDSKFPYPPPSLPCCIGL